MATKRAGGRTKAKDLAIETWRGGLVAGKATAAKAIVRVSRQGFGVMSGVHGRIAYHYIDQDEPGGEANQLDGLGLEYLLGRTLHDGAVLEVTVKVWKEGRVKWNPWLNRDGSRKNRP